MKNLLCLITLSVCISINMMNAQEILTADVYSSYFGGTNSEYNDYIEVDNDGNVLLAGHTYSAIFPLVNAYQNIFGGGEPDRAADGFITKFNPDMTSIIFSTYLGGTGYDEIKDIGVDSAGNIYVIGMTSSLDFPVTNNAFQKNHNTDNGANDGFLAMLSPDGRLLYSSYVGGDSEDYAFQITVIDSSKIYITGTTYSDNFPLFSAYTDTLSGDVDIFLFAFDIAANAPIFSTFLGGIGEDRPQKITTDTSGNIYLCGCTRSSNFPTISTNNSSYSGKQDGFITKFSNNGNIIYSRLIGGTENDCVVGIDVNSKNEAYFIGNTASSGFECSPNAFNSNKIGGFDIIIGKLSDSGDSILYLSYFGSTGTENVFDFGDDIKYHMGKIRLINDETIVINGITNSSGFPVSENAYDKQISGFDIFITVLNIGKKEVLYSTLLGGTGNEAGEDLTLFSDSIIYVCGNTGASNYPTSTDAYSRIISGDSDDVFARFKLREAPISLINNTVSEEDEIILFPNPINQLVNISFSKNPVQMANIEIFNLRGSTVFSKTLFNSTIETIDVSAYPAGMYLIKINFDGKIYEEKIVKK